MDRVRKLIQELRWWADRDDDLDHDLCNACYDAADVLDKACGLADAIDRYTRQPDATNWTEVLIARKELK